jgi:hypothetical protein
MKYGVSFFQEGPDGFPVIFTGQADLLILGFLLQRGGQVALQVLPEGLLGEAETQRRALYQFIG